MPKNQKKLTKADIKAFIASDRAILMICISIAFVFWLLTKLSYSYKDSLVINIEYEMPQDKVFTYPPAQQLEVDIGGKGWDLLSLAFSNEERVISIPVEENEIRTISSSSLNTKVMNFIPKVNILNIYPENIRLQTEDVASKIVPIVLDAQIELAPLYQYVDTIHVAPQKIEIKGPASIIRDIKEWKTNVFIPAAKVDKNIDVELSLTSHPNSNIIPSTNRIRCTAAVEEVTEKRLKVPIKVINAPDSLLLVILPKKVEVSCRVGLSDYAKLKEADFELIADFKTVDLYNANTIKLLLKKKPFFVKQVSYTPRKVDYIIRTRGVK